jgi:Glycosyl transferase family 2
VTDAPGTHGASPLVSVITPAYNAAATLGDALTSVLNQTFADWEGILVDDGSTDDTAAVAMRFVETGRFRLIRQANGGQSAARNTGIAAARGAWLVYLDSDDWLAREYLERMTDAIARDPTLDAVVCGCARVWPSGELGETAIYELSAFDDPFPAFAVDCPVAMHNCMVRKRLVQSVGGFDTSLRACADWDHWQRIARTGPRFGIVRDVLAFYRMRPGSLATRADRALLDGCAVIRRGHARDPRVPSPDPRYVDGLPVSGLPEALYRQAIWAASIMLAQRQDPRPLLSLMGDERAPSLDPERVARWMFRAIPHAGSQRESDWPTIWPEVVEHLRAYFDALESQSGAEGLALRCFTRMREFCGQT